MDESTEQLSKSSCLKGQLTQTLNNPSSRTALTLSCQCCNKTYTRAQDLAAHIQNAHAQVWQTSIPLTKILVDVIYADRGCVCNPAIGQTRLAHVCLPLRQLAMRYCRSSQGPFWPIALTEAELTQVLPAQLSREARFVLERMLTPGSFAQIFDDAVLQVLNTHCLCCGLQFDPVTLAAHVREAHTRNHQTVAFFLDDVLPLFTAKMSCDFQCIACEQIFNLPATAASDSVSRQALVTQHLLKQCPVTLQSAVLLSSALHGGKLLDGTFSRWRSSSDAHGLPEPDSCPPGRRSQTGRKPKRDQAATGQPSTGPSTGSGKRRRSGEQDSAAARNTGVAPRSGTERYEDGGHLRALFQQGAKWGTPGHAESSGTLASETPPLQDHVDGAADPSPGGGQQQEGGCSAHTCSPASTDPGRLHLALPAVGCGPTEADSQQAHPHQHAEDAGALHRTPGDVSRSELGVEVPCNEGSDLRPDQSMEAPAECEIRQPLRASSSTEPMQCVDFAGHLDAPTHTTPEWPGNPAPKHAGQIQGEGQRQEQGQQGTHRPQAGDVTQPAVKELLHALSHMIMHNDSNWCYANATFLSAIWTMLFLSTFEPSFWGSKFAILADFLLASNPHDLASTDWFQQVLQLWDRPSGRETSQQDSAEFAVHFLKWLCPDADTQQWERRVQEKDSIRVEDCCRDFMPIVLQFPMEFIRSATHITLQELVNTWKQVNGMRAGLLHAPQFLCLHIDRFLATGGNIDKCQLPIILDAECYLPTFAENSIHTEQTAYVPVAVLAHLGTASGGHFRAGLRVQPEVLGTQPVQWLLTDDDQRPHCSWMLPTWLVENLTFVWLLRSDCLQLHTYAPLPVEDHTTAAQAVLELLPVL